jgi:hypothetical protein
MMWVSNPDFSAVNPEAIPAFVVPDSAEKEPSNIEEFFS